MKKENLTWPEFRKIMGQKNLTRDQSREVVTHCNRIGEWPSSEKEAKDVIDEVIERMKK